MRHLIDQLESQHILSKEEFVQLIQRPYAAYAHYAADQHSCQNRQHMLPDDGEIVIEDKRQRDHAGA